MDPLLPELIYLIGEQLNGKDFLSFSLTCKSVSQALAHDRARWRSMGLEDLCWDGDINGLRYLASIGVDVTTPDLELLNLAVTLDHWDIVRYLASIGADVTTECNLAVRWASAGGDLDMVKFLVSKGADPTSEDNTAIRWAHENRRSETVEYLTTIGCKLQESEEKPLRRRLVL